MTSIDDDLRAALEAALPDMAPDQAQAARTLLAALTPPMVEPTWPGAPVVAACNSVDLRRLHTRRNDGPNSGWECKHCCTETEWDRLDNPRPLTPAEYAEYGIPSECEQPHAEPITDELIERCAQAGWGAERDDALDLDDAYRRIAIGVLRAAGHPEADR